MSQSNTFLSHFLNGYLMAVKYGNKDLDLRTIVDHKGTSKSANNGK